MNFKKATTEELSLLYIGLDSIYIASCEKTRMRLLTKIADQIKERTGGGLPSLSNGEKQS